MISAITGTGGAVVYEFVKATNSYIQRGSNIAVTTDMEYSLGEYDLQINHDGSFLTIPQYNKNKVHLFFWNASSNNYELFITLDGTTEYSSISGY